MTVQDKCVLTQFLSDGTPDPGFGHTGKDSFPAGALKTVAFQQDGKILVGSDSYWEGYVRPVTLFRRLANGGQDSIFGQFVRVDRVFANYFAPTISQSGSFSSSMRNPVRTMA